MNKLTFLLEKLEEYPNLEVIDYSSNCILGYDWANFKAYYIYKVHEDKDTIGAEFCFHMLCEVGKPFQTWFENALKRNKYKAMSNETESVYFEVLISL